MIPLSGRIWKKLEERLAKLEIRGRIEAVQTIALVRLTGTIRKLSEYRGNLLSLGLPRKQAVNTGVKKKTRKDEIIIIMVINCDWYFWHCDWRIIKGPGGFGSWRTSGDHPNDSIIEDGLNTEKSPGDLRRPAVTQIPVKNHQQTLM